MSDTTTQPTELLVSLKVASNAPLDFRGRFYRMAEAIEHAYEGMPCYVMETGKYYIFLRNAEGNLYPSDQFADLALYALKTDVTAEIQAAVAALVAQSPATLDTLNELAKALNDDPNFATTITALIGAKVDKETGKSLMTDAERAKLAAIEAEANKFVHPANHPASMIEESTEKQFVSEAQKQKLNNLPETVQTYTHPDKHPASIITEETNKRFMTDAERAKLANIQSGAMNLSKGEIEIFDEIELNDLTTTGVYHISQYAEGITDPEDPSYRKYDRGVIVVHETDGCISQVWFDSGAFHGRMLQGNWSAWSKLSYTHPNTHPASIIVEETNKRFVTTEQQNILTQLMQKPAIVNNGILVYDGDMDNPLLENLSDGVYLLKRNDDTVMHETLIVFGGNSSANQSALLSKQRFQLLSSWYGITYRVKLYDSSDNALVWSAWEYLATNKIATTSANGLMSAQDKREIESKRNTMSVNLTAHRTLTATEVIKNPMIDLDGTSTTIGYNLILPSKASMDAALFRSSVGFRCIIRKPEANGFLCGVNGYTSMTAPAVRFSVGGIVEFIMTPAGWVILSARQVSETSSY